MGISILPSVPSPLASTAPADLATAAAVGTGLFAARSDHVHRGLTTTAPLDTAPAAVVGTALLAARGDHQHKIVDTGWLAPTLQNGWIPYDANYSNAALYRKIGNVVFLRGLVKNGSSATAVVFTLPAGYRPAIIHLFACEANDTIARVQVDAAGVITPGAGSSTGWLSLSNIIFPADN